jgi:hypothetical protein
LLQTETRKSELEAGLSTNLVKRQQELEAQLTVNDPEGLLADLEIKRQELQSAKKTVDEATKNLKG